MIDAKDISKLLVKRLKDRDTTALDYVYEHYSPALYGVIYRTLNREDLAEETLQDVFLKVWELIDQYDETKGTFFTWMYRIARNRAIDMRRSKDFKSSEKSDDITYYVDSFSEQDKKEDAIGIGEALLKLEAMCRKLIHLNFFMGYSHHDISIQEEMPLGSVKTKIRGCLKKVKNELRNDFD